MANAKNDNSHTGMVKATGITLGRVKDDAAFADFVGDGFAQIETVIFGEGDGKVGRYIGELIGAGSPIERTDAKTGEVQSQKTFAFHPLHIVEGDIVTAEKITHVIPASYMMAAAVERIMDEATKLQKKAIVGLVYRGQVPTRRGFRVNDIAVFEKYV